MWCTGTIPSAKPLVAARLSDTHRLNGLNHFKSKMVHPVKLCNFSTVRCIVHKTQLTWPRSVVVCVPGVVVRNSCVFTRQSHGQEGSTGQRTEVQTLLVSSPLSSARPLITINPKTKFNPSRWRGSTFQHTQLRATQCNLAGSGERTQYLCMQQHRFTGTLQAQAP